MHDDVDVTAAVLDEVVGARVMLDGVVAVAVMAEEVASCATLLEVAVAVMLSKILGTATRSWALETSLMTWSQQ